MDNKIYNKFIICPVCSKKIVITKVKLGACKVASRDSDFCTYYENFNPLLYEVWVCEYCGYAALFDKFEQITHKDTKVIAEKIKPHWSQRSYSGERSIDSALEAFKLALYSLQVRGAKSSELAKLCIRIAWLYRMKNSEKEKDFLSFALRSYQEAYEKERFPVDKLDEFTCLYMIAELNRRLENFDEAQKWFSKLTSSNDARKNTSLMKLAREQIQLLKEQANIQDESGGPLGSRKST